MYPLRDHVIRHTLFHSIAYLFAGYSGRAVEGNDACSAAVGEWPSHGCHQVCTHNLAQMRLDFFEFDAVPEYFHLIVNSAQVVKRSRRVLICRVSCAIPSASLERGKAG